MVHARALVEETLAESPSGVPGIVLVDRLERWGLPESVARKLLRDLEDEGRLRIVAGHMTLGR